MTPSLTDQVSLGSASFSFRTNLKPSMFLPLNSFVKPSSSFSPAVTGANRAGTNARASSGSHLRSVGERIRVLLYGVASSPSRYPRGSGLRLGQLTDLPRKKGTFIFFADQDHTIRHSQ